ncbi:hypothetical protein BKP37_04015 [Anaerobacillus alkalilacustris]|uniref:Peptidase S9 prolyl oligopeptidase catalytic domain-containing protein n=1 Tax=Anaerobacillus alkalilacustris TaxID=393763 RepID=A0A1S2LZA0_9BACI|nr:alpha/beta hydrolase [Anaerobacillus alkalilacustris]OIJ17624.1 hypothetical protein BKP37_04015 [Anaerobacillus alkalilacustris]
MISMYKPAFKILLYVKYNVDPLKNSPLNVISEIDPRPILLIHGDNDQQTSVQHAFNLKEKAGAHTELWIIEGKGHFLVGDILEPESRWYREKIKKFLEENVGN